LCNVVRMKFPISRSSNSWFSMQVISEARGHSKEMPTSRMSGLRSICHARSSRKYLNKAKMIPQRLTNREIAMDLGLIFGCQRIGPAIAKLFRLFINTGSAARVERRHLIGLAIDADKRRVIFPANWASPRQGNRRAPERDLWPRRCLPAGNIGRTRTG
jgi:hypothetical protein